MLAANPASHGRLKSKPLQISTLPSNLSIVYPRSVTCQEHPISLAGSLVTTNQSPYRLYKFSHGLFSYSLQVIQCCLLHMWVLCHRCVYSIILLCLYGHFQQNLPWAYTCSQTYTHICRWIFGKLVKLVAIDTTLYALILSGSPQLI